LNRRNFASARPFDIRDRGLQVDISRLNPCSAAWLFQFASEHLDFAGALSCQKGFVCICSVALQISDESLSITFKNVRVYGLFPVVVERRHVVGARDEKCFPIVDRKESVRRSGWELMSGAQNLGDDCAN